MKSSPWVFPKGFFYACAVGLRRICAVLVFDRNGAVLRWVLQMIPKRISG
jgi:hypothetical protein